MNKSNSFLAKYFLISILLVSFLFCFTACNNFLSGNNLQQQIAEKIMIENAPKAKLRVSIINDSHGTVLQDGLNDIKINVPFEVTVEPDQNFKFIRWVAFESKYINEYFASKSKASSFEEFYEKDNIKYVSEDIITITNPTSTTATVTVKSEQFDAVIVPLIVSRPAIVATSIGESGEVCEKNKIVITFNRPLDPDKILLHNVIRSDKAYSRQTHTPVTLLNPEYIYCMARPKDFYTEEECTPALHYYEASINGNQLILTPYINQNHYYTLYDMLVEKTDNKTILNYYKKCKGNPGSTVGWITDNFGQTHNYFAREYMDLYLTEKFEDIYGITTAKKSKYSWLRGSDDTEPPVLLDVRFFNPTNALSYYAPAERGIENKGTGYLYDIKELNDNWDTYSGSIISNLSLTETARYKDRLMMYVRAKDAETEQFPSSDINVKQINYNFYKVRDKDLNPVSDYDTRINVEKAYTSTYPMGIDEVSLPYENGQFYHQKYDTDELTKERNWDYEAILAENNGAGILCDFNLRNLSEGLYCLEIYGADTKGNYGNKTKYTYTSNTLMYYPQNRDYSKYCIQYWFYLDRTSPVVTSSDFMPNQNWYNAETIQNFYLKENVNKTIKDGGIDELDTKSFYSIYKILNPSEVSSWKPDVLSKTGWHRMGASSDFADGGYVMGYGFWYAYGEESWYPENLEDGYHDVYTYVKDSVGNMTSKIKIEGALKYDNTPAEIQNYSKCHDSDGSAIHTGVSDYYSGVKAFRFSIKDENGNDYDDIHYIYVFGTYLVDGRDYTLDAENKIITFKDEWNDLDLYFGPEFPTEDTKLTVGISFIDTAGNESEMLFEQLKYNGE